MLADAPHHRDQQRHQDQHHPGAEQRTWRSPTSIATIPVVTAPMPLIAARRRQRGSSVAQPPPVPDHAALAQREGDEHADGVERDQVGDAAAEDHDQDRRDRTASSTIPPVNASRSPRNWKMRGTKRSRARMLGSRGKSAKAVLAASTSSSAVESCTR